MWLLQEGKENIGEEEEEEHQEDEEEVDFVPIPTCTL